MTNLLKRLFNKSYGWVPATQNANPSQCAYLNSYGERCTREHNHWQTNGRYPAGHGDGAEEWVWR